MGPGIVASIGLILVVAGVYGLLGSLDKGGQNAPNTDSARPPSPGGSGGCDARPMCCAVCKKQLLPVILGGAVCSPRRPDGGGELLFRFGCGSHKFDEGGTTVFGGWICDDCAENLLPTMSKVQKDE